jgi:hypothetical protein
MSYQSCLGWIVIILRLILIIHGAISTLSINGGNIKTKIVCLVKGSLIHAQLQYDGTWDKGLSVAKINYYGNQSAL